MKKFTLVICLLFLPFIAFAAQKSPTQIIDQQLMQSVSRWNQGDVDAFMTGYKNSPDTLYISKTIIQGYNNIEKRYRTHYATRADMGTLSFSDVTIKLLSQRYAMVIGHWHLVRQKGDNLDGIFTLLYEKTSQGWKIVVDHTS